MREIDYKKLVKLTETIWQVNRYALIKSIERQSKAPVSSDCLPLIEFCFRQGCIAMEHTIGNNRRADA